MSELLGWSYNLLGAIRLEFWELNLGCLQFLGAYSYVLNQEWDQNVSSEETVVIVHLQPQKL